MSAGEPSFGPVLQHRGVGDAGVEPDVEDVRFLVESPLPHEGQAVPGGRSSSASRSNQTSAPCFLEEVGDVVHDSAVGQDFAAVLAVEGRDGHAPGALAGDAPVGPVLDHAVDPVLAPVGDPVRPVRSPPGPSAADRSCPWR